MTEHPIRVDVNNKVGDVVDVMNEEELHCIPAINGKKLVGLVTEGMISKKSASEATSLSIYELSYLPSKTSVDVIMIRDITTIHEDRLLEDTVLLIYRHDISCLPVANDINEATGIPISNDVLSALPDILGYCTSGSRVCIEVKDELGTIGKISEIFVHNNCDITHLGIYSQRNGFADMVIRIDTSRTNALASNLEANGYKMSDITKNPN